MLSTQPRRHLSHWMKILLFFAFFPDYHFSPSPRHILLTPPTSKLHIHLFIFSHTYPLKRRNRIISRQLIDMVQDNYPETFVQKTAPLLASLGVQPATYAKKQLYTILNKPPLGRNKFEETESELPFLHAWCTNVNPFLF